MSKELEEQIARIGYEFGAPKAYFDWDKAQGKDREWHRRKATAILDLKHNGIPVRDYLKIPPEVVKKWEEGKLYEAVDAPSSMLGVKFVPLASGG